MKVYVYRNFTLKCWSIKALEGPNKGRVVTHADGVHLAGCEFKVSEAGRQRVLREKCKNVHAGVVGELYGWWAIEPVDRLGDRHTTSARMLTPPLRHTRSRLIRYNPYLYDTFVVNGQQPVWRCDHVWLLAWMWGHGFNAKRAT